MNYRQLYLAWMSSYRSNRNHALRDAELNLRGFTPNFRQAMDKFSVDYAFSVAIRKTLKQNLDTRVRAAYSAIDRQVG